MCSDIYNMSRLEVCNKFLGLWTSFRDSSVGILLLRKIRHKNIFLKLAYLIRIDFNELKIVPEQCTRTVVNQQEEVEHIRQIAFQTVWYNGI
jgi:hypothetical protein